MSPRRKGGSRAATRSDGAGTGLLVPPERLRAVCDPGSLSFECTEDVVPLTDFVGQDRAVRALEFGLGLQRPGYNIFVTGLTGTGRTTAILDYIGRQVKARKEKGNHAVHDWCYVYNFLDADRPNAIAMAPGTGRRFQEAMVALLESIRANLVRIFTSEEYERQRRALVERGGERAQEQMHKAQQDAEAAGFALNFSPTGVNLAPIKDGRPMTAEEFAALPAAGQQEIQQKERALGELVNQVGEQLRAIEREVGSMIQEMDRQVVAAVVTGPFDHVKKEYSENEEVPEFLDRLREFTLKSADFLRQFAVSPVSKEMPEGTLLATVTQGTTLDPFIAFRVNLLVDNGGTEGPPIVTEANPSWSNLFGRIDRRAYMGTYLSDHTMLKPGAVHRANGGYLVLNYNDLATRPGAWEGLKRVIKTGEVRIEDPMEQWGLLSPQGLRPEAIPVDVKLVVAGDPTAYFLHSTYEEEFWEMFKVKADFDHQIPRDETNILAYAGYICAICNRDGLRHFDRTAVAQLVEWGSRQVDDQTKLSARFGRMRDVVVEADYWAGEDGADLVRGEHVDRAINERVYRLNMIEERVREMIERGTIMIDTEGSVPGQVNGLAVMDYGDLRFGRPARITARVHPGQRGVVSIDRESHLSGKIHDKGVLTLTGFLGWMYGQERPLSLSATVSFEQGYEMVDGDSASLAETCAILSAIADLPIKQGIAMTGSMNQKGEVQPIGGVNQKVEGFHDVCKVIGFTGEQGVIVPRQNIQNLMLREDVVTSVREGNFRVWEASTLDDALEILTGMPAGERDKDGKYPDGTVHHVVEKSLRDMADRMKKASAPARGKKKEEAKDEEEEPEPDAPPPAKKRRRPRTPGPRDEGRS
jgi:predicted ATP-dependent protease